MSRKIILMIALALAAMLVLSACEQSASGVLPPTWTVGAPLSLDTPTGMPLVSQYGTQTAWANETAQAGQGISLATETPTPDETEVASGTVVPPTGAATTAATNTVPAVIVATSTPGRPATYTLQQGEYPYCIARRFNVDPKDLLTLNNIVDGGVYQPGMQLKIPQTGSFPGDRALRPHPAQYTVKVDDTIYRVACYYGDLDPTQIAAANALTAPYTLTTGQVLNIP